MKTVTCLTAICSSLAVFFLRVKCLNGDKNGTDWAALGTSFASRMLWMTHDRKFVLPKGTILDIAPRLQIPFLRQPPEGLNSDIQMTWHFYMYFDKLGMTSDRHPWPPVYPFSGFFPYSRLPMAQPGGNLDGSDSSGNRKEDKEEDDPHRMNKTKIPYGYYHSFGYPPPFYKRRNPRAVISLPPPENLPGGERATVIPQLEKMLSSIGYDGRNCLLRAVCEIHEYPLHKMGYGLFGEIVTLVFTASLSEYSESHLPEYVKAELAGKRRDCSTYAKKCEKSMFQWEPKLAQKF